MKKLPYIVGGLILLALLAYIVVPIVLDPNQYKGEITKQFEEKTGYKLDIAGDIEISIFPLPHAYVNDVTISNGSSTLAQVKEISAYVELSPLFSGKVQVQSVKITEPKITLEKTATGNNWTARKKEEEPTAEATLTSKEGKQTEISIDDIKIVDGLVSYKTETDDIRLEKMNLSASLASVAGPVKFNGKVEYKGKEVALDGSVENFAEPKITLNAEAVGTKLNFAGGTKKGSIAVKSDDLNPLLDAIGKSGQFSIAKPKLDVSGGFEIAEGQYNLSDLKVKLGNTSGIGAVVFAPGAEGAPDRMAANIKFDNIVVDELMPSKKQEEKKEEETKRKSKGPGMEATINFVADKVAYKKGLYKNLSIKADIARNQISLEPASIGLPGGGRVDIYGLVDQDSLENKHFDGRIDIYADSLRKIMESFDVKLDSIKPGKLQKFNLSSEINVSMKNKIALNLSAMKGSIDNTNFNGSFSYAAGTPADIKFIGTFDQLDLDSLLVEGNKAASTAASSANGSDKIDFTWLSQFGNDIDLNIGIGQLKKGGENYANIRANGRIKKGEIDFTNLSGSSSKFNAAGKFKLNATGKRPRFEVNLNVERIDTAKFISGGTTTSTGQATTAPGQWSEKPIKFAPLDQLDGEFRLTIGTLLHKNIQLNNLLVSGALKDEVASFDKISASGFDGTIDAKGSLNVGRVPAFDFKFSGANFNLYKMLTTLMSNDRVTGYASLNGEMKSSGVNQKTMVNNLNGAIALAAQQVTVRGFDLEAFANQITNINSAFDLIGLANSFAKDNATTKINSAKGNISIEKGVFNTTGIELDAGVAQGLIKGYASLPAWNMDMRADFKLVMADKKDRPGVGFRIYGPLHAPKQERDLDDLRNYAADRIAKGLLGNKTGGKIGGVLQGVQGLQSGDPNAVNDLIGAFGKDKKKPAATTTEPSAAPSEAAPATETAPAAEPELTPKQKKKQAKEQMINDIFKAIQ